MKLSKKLTSILCAAALLVSALPAAAAVSADPLSEYAGKTIPVQVVEDTKDGLVSRIINVAIPQGATKAEERAIIHAAAFGWDLVSAHSENEVMLDICSKTNFTINKTATWVGGKRLTDDLVQIVFDFCIAKMDSNTRLCAQVKNETADSTTDWVFDTETITFPGYEVERIIFKSSSIKMEAGDYISAYAKTNGGRIDLDYCYVTGYVSL